MFWHGFFVGNQHLVLQFSLRVLHRNVSLPRCCTVRPTEGGLELDHRLGGEPLTCVPQGSELNGDEPSIGELTVKISYWLLSSLKITCFVYFCGLMFEWLALSLLEKTSYFLTALKLTRLLVSSMEIFYLLLTGLFGDERLVDKLSKDNLRLTSSLKITR